MTPLSHSYVLIVCPLLQLVILMWFTNDIREVLVKGNSVSLRLSASTDNLSQGKSRNLTLHLS